MATTSSNRGSSGGTDTIRPSQSLYVSNLSVKEKREDLRRLLYMTFTSEAQVIDVNVLKSAKMQGQAHILFKDTPSATYAMEKLAGSMFLERPLRIAYSKNRSKTLDKMLGTNVEPVFEKPKIANGLAASPGRTPVPPSGLPRPPGSALPPPPSGLPAPPGAISGPINSFELPPAPRVSLVPAQSQSDGTSVKRKHGGSDDEEEQEDDDDAAMEMSSDEDD